MFSSDSRVNKHTKLTPLQLVTGQQPVLPPKREATQRNAPFMSQTRISHIGMHSYETSEENSHEVKAQFQSTADTLITKTIGNQE